MEFYWTPVGISHVQDAGDGTRTMCGRVIDLNRAGLTRSALKSECKTCQAAVRKGEAMARMSADVMVKTYIRVLLDGTQADHVALVHDNALAGVMVAYPQLTRAHASWAMDTAASMGRDVSEVIAAASQDMAAWDALVESMAAAASVATATATVPAAEEAEAAPERPLCGTCGVRYVRRGAEHSGKCTLCLLDERVPSEHRHEASYRYVISSGNGMEYGTCGCGESIERPTVDGVAPIDNLEAWRVRRPLCATCGVAPAAHDGESAGYFSNCERCSLLVSGAPRCPLPMCLEGGHTSHKTLPVVDGDKVTYRCATCGTVMSADDWATLSGTVAGKRDMEHNAWLVPVRRETQLRFREPTAYGRAYLAATEGILSAGDVATLPDATEYVAVAATVRLPFGKRKGSSKTVRRTRQGHREPSRMVRHA